MLIKPPSKVNPNCKPTLEILTIIKIMPINNISVLIMEKSANHFVARDVYFFTEYPSVKNFLFIASFAFVL